MVIFCIHVSCTLQPRTADKRYFFHIKRLPNERPTNTEQTNKQKTENTRRVSRVCTPAPHSQSRDVRGELIDSQLPVRFLFLRTTKKSVSGVERETSQRIAAHRLRGALFTTKKKIQKKKYDHH